MNKKIVKKLNKNLSLIYSECEIILKNHKEGRRISEKEYIWFVFSADIYYRAKDIIFLNKKLDAAKNNFDSSLYVLSRSVLETFIYLQYLLCEEDKIKYRLRAFICHSTRNNDLKMLYSLKSLGSRGKFIFSDNPKDIQSSKMIDEKINEFNDSIKEHLDFYKNNKNFEKEIEIFKKIETVAQKYDEINHINSVNKGSEHLSMEWMYNFIYRFQCMSVHQSLRDKEKVFNLFESNNKKPNNAHILESINDIAKQILILIPQKESKQAPL